MGFRRGFKSQCERRSVEIRKDLGIASTDPLLAPTLAEHYGIKVWGVSDVQGLSKQDIRDLIINDDDCWSALTMRIQNKHLIIYKDNTSDARINSVVMHELSHIILGHQLAHAMKTNDGALAPQNFSQDQEDEADWLAGTLLLPRPALLKVLRAGLSNRNIQKQYCVSAAMLNYRVRMTGVRHQLFRARA